VSESAEVTSPPGSARRSPAWRGRWAGSSSVNGSGACRRAEARVTEVEALLRRFTTGDEDPADLERSRLRELRRRTPS
jgi:hypothetical protein